MATSLALKRIKKELEDIKRHPPLEMSIGPSNESNLFHWEGMLNGPDGTLFQGGIFKFTVDFPKDYPMSPPHVLFTTKIFHPNISESGEICVDILKQKWSSVYDISKVMLSISSLLSDPNPDSAYNGDAARLYRNDRQTYNKTVKQWVKKHASPENL